MKTFLIFISALFILAYLASGPVLNYTSCEALTPVYGKMYKVKDGFYKDVVIFASQFKDNTISGVAIFGISKDPITFHCSELEVVQ